MNGAACSRIPVVAGMFVFMLFLPVGKKKLESCFKDVKCRTVL